MKTLKTTKQLNQSFKLNRFTVRNCFFHTSPVAKEVKFVRTLKPRATSILYNHTIIYPTPANLTYFWRFGSLAGGCLLLQILTGIFLAMHYSASATLRFASVEHIMRDVSGGWLIRYAHANGASAFFAVVYLHILRALLYRRYSFGQWKIWLSGCAILILMMATAFIGYVLPWGQMSFWGATVITSFFSVVPFIGTELVQWLWGGFSVGAPTLARFYSLHYLLPFVLRAVVLIHFFQLHMEGSSNPFPLEHREINNFYLPLYPYFLVKDLFGFFCFAVVFSYFLFYAPNALGHTDNYIEANPLVTPEHIVPEWYFLPFYAILRSIPDKTSGIVAMGLALLYLAQLPLAHYCAIKLGVNPQGVVIWRSRYRVRDIRQKIYVLLVVLFVCCFVLLGFIGARPVSEPYLEIGFICTVSFFILIELITIFAFFNFSSESSFFRRRQ